jgi:uncharacterized protein (TIGR01615 family)
MLAPCSPQAVPPVGRAALKIAFHRAPSVGGGGAAVTPGAAAAFVAQLAAPKGAAEEALAALAAAFLDASSSAAAASEPHAPPGGDAELARALAGALRAAGYAAVAVEDGCGVGATGAAQAVAARPGSPAAAVHASLRARAARHVFVAVDAAGAPTPTSTRRVHTEHSKTVPEGLTANEGDATPARLIMSATHHALIRPLSGASFSELLIVEPRLREQFETPRPSAVYSAVLAALPRVFVGTETRLAALVTWLAARLRDAFAAASMALPPWRSCLFLLAKWRLNELSSSGGHQRENEEPSADDDDPCVARRAATLQLPPRPLSASASAASLGAATGGVVIMQQRSGLTFTARVAACTPRLARS